MKKTLWLSVCLLISAVLTSAQNFKNLAGSPEEMDAMRLPAAETLGTRSKAAMIPVRFDAKGNFSADIPIETAEDLKVMLVSPESSAWQVKIKNGDGEVSLREGHLLVERRNGEIGIEGEKYPAEVFTFDYARGGAWKFEISGGNTTNFREGETSGYLVISSKTPYQIYTSLDTLQTVTGREIGINTRIFDAAQNLETGIPESLRAGIESAEAEMHFPNGSTQKLTLRDTGNGNFKTDFVPQRAGEYNFQVTVRGTLPTGEKFIRTSEQIIRVAGDKVRFGKNASANLIDDTRLQINLPANGLRAGRKVIAYGEVWGKNSDGSESPVAWLSGMSIAEGMKSRTNLPLVLDGRWLARASSFETYELRNVRVQDPDYFVTLAETDSVALGISKMPESALKGWQEITDEMRTGKRPEIEVSNNAVGGKLMLVHGYCSGGNGFPTGQFSNVIVFNDPNQNRTHDQFANLIRNFGAAYPSFGIVAHSQGGAASLHLYTYYWSGLDSATGNRLIQSVGTPYQGTALAGNLAALGSVFGAGCGSNYDLTYSGAAAWLAGIPSWARAKVHYSTTSFTDVWWRYDYCQIVSDPFLSDPDDGVVERAYAQLSGANNRGHKTGWCHTGGMRDPSQTTDSARNADMNANAAR